MEGIFVHGYMLIMWSICIPVLLITSLFALSSYEVYTLTSLCHICTWSNLLMLHICVERHIYCWPIHGNNMWRRYYSLLCFWHCWVYIPHSYVAHICNVAVIFGQWYQISVQWHRSKDLIHMHVHMYTYVCLYMQTYINIQIYMSGYIHA